MLLDFARGIISTSSRSAAASEGNFVPNLATYFGMFKSIKMSLNIYQMSP